jgi:ABC-2 type transport system permease protein
LRGLIEHLKLTLLLNFRSRQALIYGYLVPILFLIAFGSIFRSSTPPLLRQLGQLLTISVLGGACFGMPTSMVAERERGVWRRYRLLPAATGSLVFSTMIARFIIVLSAAVMQIILAKLMYGMPMPAHPAEMTIAFVFVVFAFLGMGLVIAMLADAVPAVQALGQALFLPMIMIGGVGVPLWTLPTWAQHLASFLPGKYAVRALQACAFGDGLQSVGFDLVALLAIGIAACIAGAKMFRWDAHEKVAPRQRRWVGLALCAWLAVGIAAELTHRVGLVSASSSNNNFATSQPANANEKPYESITQSQINSITYEDLEPDDGPITPVAPNLDNLDAAARQRVADLRSLLATWPPAKDPSLTGRVRNLLAVAAIADLTMDPYEGVTARVIFEKLKADVARDDLEKVLTWIILNEQEKPLAAVPELGIQGDTTVPQVQERQRLYATKLLGRLTGKLPGL